MEKEEAAISYHALCGNTFLDVTKPLNLAVQLFRLIRQYGENHHIGTVLVHYFTQNLELTAKIE
jgi:hypothetical protein